MSKSFIRLPVLAGTLWAATALYAQTVTFTIDPARSRLTADAVLVVLENAPLAAQDEPAGTSRMAQYGGTIEVEVDDPTSPSRIQFLSADAAAMDSGNWLPELGGDYNDNGLVEQADLDLVLLNWGDSATPPPGNWTNDLPSGMIDQDELDGVLLNWGDQLPPLAPAESIPEPYTLLLLLLAPTPLIMRMRW